MGWFGKSLTQRQIARMTDPVAGTLRVTAASFPPAGVNAVYANYRLTGVVSGPGLEPTAVEHTGIARVAKWPQPGDDLPVTVDRARPDRLVILWEQVLTQRDQGLAAAQAEAVSMRTGLDLGVLGDAVQQTAADGGAPEWVTGLAEPAADPATAGGAAPSPAGMPASFPGPPAAGAPAPASGPPVPGRVRYELPPSTATVAVTGRVLAVREVPVPAALAPAGGVVDLTVAVPDPAGGERTAICRASFATPAERDRVAVVGATVGLLADPGDPGIVALAAAGLPGSEGEAGV